MEEEALYAVFEQMGEDIFEQTSMWLPYKAALEFADRTSDTFKASFYIFKKEAYLPYIGKTK